MAVAEHPFYIRQTAEPEHTETVEARETWFKSALHDAKKEGASWPRFSFRETPVPMLLIECWAERPADEGPQRWALRG